MRRSDGWRWGAVVVVGLIAAAFAYFNGGERVAVHLGVAVLYRVPFVGLVFIVFLLGMLTMFLLGLRHDLRLRRKLRRHGLEELLEEPDEIPEPAPRPPEPYP